MLALPGPAALGQATHTDPYANPGLDSGTGRVPQTQAPPASDPDIYGAQPGGSPPRAVPPPTSPPTYGSPSPAVPSPSPAVPSPAPPRSATLLGPSDAPRATPTTPTADTSLAPERPSNPLRLVLLVAGPLLLGLVLILFIRRHQGWFGRHGFGAP